MDNPTTHGLEEELRACKQKIQNLLRENEQLEMEMQQMKDPKNSLSSNLIPNECERSMSGEVNSENRYSRLMALQKMGVVSDYTRIIQCSVVIIGIGGIGIVAAEMLSRCGIGELILIDHDSVELANMNRMFYRPEHSGMTKVEAAKQSLTIINSDVKVSGFNLDVTNLDNYDIILSLIQSDTPSRQRLVLCCVDNFSARMSINQLCLEARVPWLESGLSENAVSGHIQFIVPGVTACFACAPPLVVATGLEASLKKEGVCVASLPTTSAIIAGLLVQNALKYILRFGKCTEVLAYNSIQDFFSSYCLKPNPKCSFKLCLQRQEEVIKNSENCMSNNIFLPQQDESIQLEEVSKDNEWNIEVVEEVADEMRENETEVCELKDLTNEELNELLKIS
ncbi:Ubiquitin-like modifier-activating enzyme 5 [Oopsacas minuta]|uniref:Ubiquitin-like modifier-activating enzyme 5 n=1 Tax=Oopsacas minuta TaxID=111878 RepID=A0AAV7K1U3_9METZ|nr:Ubiquitin-like modifier-activating enzyme 5 [Oopsacas minuta]